MEFLGYLDDNPESTYDEISNEFGVSKARVCQMVALYKRLPEQITDYLMDAEPEKMKYFTERRLRPLTLLPSDDEKIDMFNETRNQASE